MTKDMVISVIYTGKSKINFRPPTEGTCYGKRASRLLNSLNDQLNDLNCTRLDVLPQNRTNIYYCCTYYHSKIGDGTN